MAATAAKLDPQLETLGLTPRMIDVLALLLKGHSNKVIARHLGISPNTAAEYVSAILKRLEVSSRSQIPLKVRSLHQSLLDWDEARRESADLLGHLRA